MLHINNAIKFINLVIFFAKCKKSIENIIEFTVGKYIVDIVFFFYYDR